MQHAIAVMNLEPGENCIEEDALPEKDILLTVCAGIVIIDKESDVIRLVHYTTQEYFEQNRFEKFPNAQSEITEACLNYLTLDAFMTGPAQTIMRWESVQETTHFYFTLLRTGVSMHKVHQKRCFRLRSLIFATQAQPLKVLFRSVPQQQFIHSEIGVKTIRRLFPGLYMQPRMDYQTLLAPFLMENAISMPVEVTERLHYILQRKVDMKQ